MTLRFRLNLLITVVFGITLIAAMGWVIHNTRQAILEEIQSTAYLSLQLLQVAFSSMEPQSQSHLQAQFLSRIAELKKIRHLHIELLSSRELSSPPSPQRIGAVASGVPAWFAHLVTPGRLQLRQALGVSISPARELVITADPADEIMEAWEETRSLLTVLVMFFVVASGLVFVTIGWSLRPIDSILKALDSIEQGHYHSRLPAIDLPELQAIAQKFNHMAEALERSREVNRHLAQRSSAVQEQERRFLARELHDEMGQSIAAIKAVAVAISQRTNAPWIKDSARTIAQIASHLHEVVRGMVRRLRPVVLDELGLVMALQDIIDDWNAHHKNAFCRFSAKGNLEQLSDAINITLYRIVQECLTNVAKHAHATEVDISLQRGPIKSSDSEVKSDFHDAVVLTITDNGIGLALQQTPRGLGLLGMQERVEALNGIFRLVNSPGQGVSIHVALPVKEQHIASE